MTTAACARKAVALCVEAPTASPDHEHVDLELEIVPGHRPGVEIAAGRQEPSKESTEVASAGDARRLKRAVISLALAILLVVVLITSVPGLHTVATELDHAQTGWIVLAICLELLSCVGFVIAFHLVFNRAPFRFAARVAWSEMAFGAVLPAGGAGGLAVGAWILHAKGFPLNRVASRSAVLFLLTSAVNAVVLTLSGLALATGLLPGPHSWVLAWVPTIVGAATLTFFAALPWLAARFARGDGRASAWLRATAQVVRDTERALLSRDWRLIGAVAYLLCDIGVLWACFQAFGSSPPLAAIVLGYQIGYLANIVPVPGGIGALDGGLIGALLLYGTPATATAAAVLVYHAVALWVPTSIGALEFWLVRRNLHEPIVLKPATS